MLECVVNISAGDDTLEVDAIAVAGGADLLDVHSDPHHNRSVLTLVGEDAPRRVARAAVERLDLRVHSGVHPRIGVVDVVPFGIPAAPPQAAAQSPLRAAFPAIGSEDRVLLWAGGLWGWLDPDTAMRATALLDHTHLVVMGTGRPGPARTGQEPFGERALELARREGLEGERVHFNAGWVPYAERGALDQSLELVRHHSA